MSLSLRVGHMKWLHTSQIKTTKKESCNFFLSTFPINLLKCSCCCDQWQCVWITLGVSIIFPWGYSLQNCFPLVFNSYQNFFPSKVTFLILMATTWWSLGINQVHRFSKISFAFLKAVSGSLNNLSSSSWKIILPSWGERLWVFPLEDQPLEILGWNAAASHLSEPSAHLVSSAAPLSCSVWTSFAGLGAVGFVYV